MRVGLVCPYSLTLPGGVQTQVLAMARVLRRNGVEARVLGPCDGPPPETGVTPLGNSMHTHANGSMASIAPDPAAALRTIRALRDEDFDIVHLHEPVVPGPCLTALVFCPSPMVGTFHRAGAGAWYRSWRRASRWTVERLAARVAVSPAAAATARETMGGDYEVLWNGVDVASARAVPPWTAQAGAAAGRCPGVPGRQETAVAAGSGRAGERRGAGPAGVPTVLFVGRHEERKGLAVLIDAVGRLDRPVVLWVVGDGPETARLRAATAGDERIEWLGAVSETEKLARLRAADVFCAPSLHGESFGVVLLEALAAGATVVASDLDGYRNVVRDGVEGLLSPPGDPAELAVRLEVALDAGRDGPFASAGRERADELGMDRLVERYLDIYRRVLASR